MSPVHRKAAPQRPLPSGTVMFGFTDIDGSAVRGDLDRGAMRKPCAGTMR